MAPAYDRPPSHPPEAPPTPHHPAQGDLGRITPPAPTAPRPTSPPPAEAILEQLGTARTVAETLYLLLPLLRVQPLLYQLAQLELLQPHFPSPGRPTLQQVTPPEIPWEQAGSLHPNPRMESYPRAVEDRNGERLFLFGLIINRCPLAARASSCSIAPAAVVSWVDWNPRNNYNIFSIWSMFHVSIVHGSKS